MGAAAKATGKHCESALPPSSGEDVVKADDKGRDAAAVDYTRLPAELDRR